MSELLQSAVKVTCDGTTLADFGEESIQPKVITVPSPQAAALPVAAAIAFAAASRASARISIGVVPA